MEESRSHLPPIKMQLVHFGSDEQATDPKSNAGDGNIQQKGKDTPAPVTVNAKAMANEVKLEQERRKVYYPNVHPLAES